MKIFNPKTGEEIETHCDGGCMHHQVKGVQMGSDPHVCEECGCPTTEKGWARWLEAHPDATPVKR